MRRRSTTPVPGSQLSTRQQNFHTSQLVVEEAAPFRPLDNIVFAPDYGNLAAPATLTDYFGPESPDLIWQRFPFRIEHRRRE